MKKFLASLLVGAMLVLGCAATQVKTQTTQIPYYETVYWGDEQSCDMGDTRFVGRCTKTQQAFPEKDMNWVVLENTNNDDVSVTMVWDMPEAPVIGTCFFLDQTQEENCGILAFDSMTSKQLFIDEFDKTGIVNAVPLPQMKQELKFQLEFFKDVVVGEDCNYCELLERYYNTDRSGE